MPVFNSENTLKRAVDSALNQSYKDIELIVIDDGSTDKSIGILIDYQNNYSNIKIITQENKGPSAARNIGILNSKGEYITFVDSDDYIEFKYIEELVNCCNKDEDIMVFCSNLEIYQSYKYKREMFKNANYKDLDLVKVCNEIVSGGAGLICGKLIDKKILTRHNIFFNESINISEDQIFLLNVAKYSKAFKYIDKPLYFYDRTNEKSITRAYKRDSFNMQKKVIDIIKGFNIEGKEITNRIYEGIHYSIRNEFVDINYKNIFNRIKNIIDIFQESGNYLEILNQKPEGRLYRILYYGVILCK